MKHHLKMLAVFAGLAVVSAVALVLIHEATLAPVFAHGARPGGEEVTGAGWLSLLAALLGTGGFSIATIVEIVQAVRTFISAKVPDGQAKDALLAAVSLAEMPLYCRLFNATDDPALKAQIRAVAKAASEAKFAKEFPEVK